MGLTKKHWLLIGGSIALFILIYLAPKTTVKEKGEVKTAAGAHEDHIKPYIDSVIAALPDKDKVLLKEKEQYFRISADSIAAFWNKRSLPAVAGYYLADFSKDHNSKANWSLTGNSYFMATRFAANEDLRHHFYEEAIEAYQKALELDPNDLDIKTRLGVSYVEGTGEPMKGITYLREVVSKDSTNTEAQLNLALFAIQSGQYDKAAARLEKLAAMKPEFAEVYLYLGQTYAAMNDKDKAIEALSKFSSMTNDPLVRSEVEKYIKELKNS